MISEGDPEYAVVEKVFVNVNPKSTLLLGRPGAPQFMLFPRFNSSSRIFRLASKKISSGKR